jgi:hypothetical protein
MTVPASDPILALPIIGEPLADEARWRYPAPGFAGGHGYARLRVWAARGARGDGVLAVVTELGQGVSITNAIADIWQALKMAYQEDLWLIEHWPASQAPESGEHLDAVIVDRQQPLWARVWPASPSHPSHSQLAAWMAVNGAQVLGG